MNSLAKLDCAFLTKYNSKLEGRPLLTCPTDPIVSDRLNCLFLSINLTQFGLRLGSP